MDTIYFDDLEMPNGLMNMDIEMLDSKPVDTSLAGLTTIYWRISYKYHLPKHSQDYISVEQANRKLNLILKSISDTRPLWKCASNLQWAIIVGNGADDDIAMTTDK